MTDQKSEKKVNTTCQCGESYIMVGDQLIANFCHECGKPVRKEGIIDEEYAQMQQKVSEEKIAEENSKKAVSFRISTIQLFGYTFIIGAFLSYFPLTFWIPQSIEACGGILMPFFIIVQAVVYYSVMFFEVMTDDELNIRIKMYEKFLKKQFQIIIVFLVAFLFWIVVDKIPDIHHFGFFESFLRMLMYSFFWYFVWDTVIKKE